MNDARRIENIVAHEHWAFSDGHQGILYDRENLRVSLLSSDLAAILEEVLSEIRRSKPRREELGGLDDILAAYNKQGLPNLLAGLSMPERATTFSQAPLRLQAKHYLNKLAINVASSCNLSCTYCYANEGLYGGDKRSLLAPEDIVTYITRFADRFDYIEGVQYMGGEPSMNGKALHAAGECFRKLVVQGKLLGEPRYTIVTNGLYFDDRFIDACKMYNIELTVSLDGPQAAHDKARPRRNGGGSYAAIRKNIDLARAAGLSIEFEPTFSRAHLANGISLIDLVEWFHSEFGVTTLHAPPLLENRHEKGGLGLSNSEKIQQYCAVTEWGIDNIIERKRYVMHAFTARILESIETRKRNSHTCPAGNSLLSVSTKGDISPCWMFTDEVPFKMGSVHDNELLGRQAANVLDLLDKNELHSHPECKKCFIQPMCFGCKGGDYHATASAEGKTNCDYMRAMVLTGMMRVYSRPSVPESVEGYYERPSFGEINLMGIRP